MNNKLCTSIRKFMLCKVFARGEKLQSYRNVVQIYFLLYDFTMVQMSSGLSSQDTVQRSKNSKSFCHKHWTQRTSKLKLIAHLRIDIILQTTEHLHVIENNAPLEKDFSHRLLILVKSTVCETGKFSQCFRIWCYVFLSGPEARHLWAALECSSPR